MVGSSASTATTLLFLYVLVRFPQFIRRVKEDGGDPSIVLRLVMFYQLNVSARIITTNCGNMSTTPVRTRLVQILVYHSAVCIGSGWCTRRPSDQPRSVSENRVCYLCFSLSLKVLVRCVR